MWCVCVRARPCVCVCVCVCVCARARARVSYATVCRFLINRFIDWLLHLMRPMVKGWKEKEGMRIQREQLLFWQLGQLPRDSVQRIEKDSCATERIGVKHLTDEHSLDDITEKDNACARPPRQLMKMLNYWWHAPSVHHKIGLRQVFVVVFQGCLSAQFTHFLCVCDGAWVLLIL